MAALANHVEAEASEYTFVKGSETLVDGEHFWWRNIDALPEENQLKVKKVIAEDAVSYKDLGYRVQLDWAEDGYSVELYVRHKRAANSSHIALLAGAAGATKARAGWEGGPG